MRRIIAPQSPLRLRAFPPPRPHKIAHPKVRERRERHRIHPKLPRLRRMNRQPNRSPRLPKPLGEEASDQQKETPRYLQPQHARKLCQRRPHRLPRNPGLRRSPPQRLRRSFNPAPHLRPCSARLARCCSSRRRPRGRSSRRSIHRLHHRLRRMPRPIPQRSPKPHPIHSHQCNPEAITATHPASNHPRPA